MTYRITGLDPAPYQPLFELDADQLAARHMVRMTVDGPGFPCRVSLTDRAIGESVLLLNHVSHDVAGPYRASHAIFVAECDQRPADYVDALAPAMRIRVLSLRGFGRNGMMIKALVAQRGEADAGIHALFEHPDVVEVHAHTSDRGCFLAKVERH